jgi:hypothetical protein
MVADIIYRALASSIRLHGVQKLCCFAQEGLYSQRKEEFPNVLLLNLLSREGTTR